MTNVRNNANPYEIAKTPIATPVFNRVATIVLGIMIFATLLLVHAKCVEMDSNYSTVATVYSVDDTSTIFIDGAGYLWEVYDTDYKTGEFVTLYFDNNRTDYTRNDDKIVKVKNLDN